MPRANAHTVSHPDGSETASLPAPDSNPAMDLPEPESPKTLEERKVVALEEIAELQVGVLQGRANAADASREAMAKRLATLHQELEQVTAERDAFSIVVERLRAIVVETPPRSTSRNAT